MDRNIAEHNSLKTYMGIFMYVYIYLHKPSLNAMLSITAHVGRRDCGWTGVELTQALLAELMLRYMYIRSKSQPPAAISSATGGTEQANAAMSSTAGSPEQARAAISRATNGGNPKFLINERK